MRGARMSVSTLALAAGAVAAGVTRPFSRPAASLPLSHEAALALMHGHGHSRRLLEEDPVQQVHLGLGGSGEAVVTFATWKRLKPSAVLYGEDDSLSERAIGQASSYVTHICITNEDLLKPEMSTNGGHPDVTGQDLLDIMNTSRMYPKTSENYVFLENAAQAEKLLKEKGPCLSYKNPLGYYESPYLHTVVLKNLKPRTRYTYRPEVGTRTFSFTMPPATGAAPADAPLRLAVWGDVGITEISLAVSKQLATWQPDVNLLMGDYSYADGWSQKWETFGTIMEPLMASVPGLGVAGNHEIADGNYQGVDWERRYPQPWRESGSDSPRQFSYETGLVHVLGLPGSYAPSHNGTADRPSSQYLFASEDLASVDRSRTPWVVVMFHTPWYSSNKHHYQEGLQAQWDMEELFYKHGVNLVLNGHVHSYERSHPVYKNKVDPCGAVHIVMGDAGNMEGPAVPWRAQPDWSAFREASFGGGLLTVTNATHAQWEWRRTACASKVGDDTFFSWQHDEGLHGDNCSTFHDNSVDRFAPVDTASLVRDSNCSNHDGDFLV